MKVPGARCKAQQRFPGVGWCRSCVRCKRGFGGSGWSGGRVAEVSGSRVAWSGAGQVKGSSKGHQTQGGSTYPQLLVTIRIMQQNG